MVIYYEKSYSTSLIYYNRKILLASKKNTAYRTSEQSFI
jgi:hypothetical protein